MSQTVVTVEHLHEKAREVIAGTAPVSELQAVAAQLIPRLMAAMGQFVAEATDNPELPPEAVPQLQEALNSYQNALNQLLSVNESSSVPGLMEAIDQARRTVREAQAAHEERAKAGPALTPYLNRLLMHLDYFEAGGGETKHTLALLGDFDAFREEIGGHLQGIGNDYSREVAERALEDLEEECRSWAEVLQTGREVDRPEFCQTLRGEVVRVSEVITSELGAQIDQDLASGPTPLAYINLVFAAADRFQAGTASGEQLQEAVSHSREMLQNITSSPFAQEVFADAAEQVNGVLERIEGLVQDPDAARLTEELAQLEAAAQNLAMFLSVMDDDGVVDFTADEGLRRAAGESSGSGLPLAFESMLQLGDAWCSGDISGEALADGIRDLENMLERASRQRVSPRQQETFKQMVEAITEGVDLMWQVGETQDRFQLAQAREVFGRAAALMHQLQRAG